MLNSIEEIYRLLEGSIVEACEVEELQIDASREVAFSIQLDHVEQLRAWDYMRELTSVTNRYPLIVDDWHDCFSRFYFEEEKRFGYISDISPESIVHESFAANIKEFLGNQKKPIEEEDLTWEIESLERDEKNSPNWSYVSQLISNGNISTKYDLEKWLFDWETQNCTIDYTEINKSSFDKRWTEYEDSRLLLLPISHGWESLAYIHWWGAGSIGTPLLMSILKKWFMEFGAELVSVDGVLLQFIVWTPPSRLEAAFELAWEQNTVTSWTTEWLSLRDHARSLLSLDRWVLFDRP